MAVRADDVQADHQWERDPFGDDGRRWNRRLAENRGKLGFGLAATLIVAGWLLRDLHGLTAESGLGYLLGIVSVSCMLILLLYPLRKRFKVLKFIGPLPKWFRNHMILGTMAPIAALYHCNFQLGSLNSRIALFSALAVAGSGLIGRFIYSKIHHGLYGRKATLKELLARVKLTVPGEGVMGAIVPELRNRLSEFDRQVLNPPAGILDCITMPFALAIRTRFQRWRLMRFVRTALRHQARNSATVVAHRRQLENAAGEFIRTHLRQVRRVAEFTAYDRLFALWHKVHLPFFLTLLVTVVIHVVVVHVY